MLGDVSRSGIERAYTFKFSLDIARFTTASLTFFFFHHPPVKLWALPTER